MNKSIKKIIKLSLQHLGLDSEELWFAAGTTQAGRIDLFWGGDSSSVADSSHPMEYQPFVKKATALPSTVYTG